MPRACRRLSDLQTLRITTRTVISSGMVLVAGKKAPVINWSDIAIKFRAAAGLERQTMLAQNLTNQNSEKVLLKAAAATSARQTCSRAPEEVPLRQ